jgi:biopolymer transport protein TolR
MAMGLQKGGGLTCEMNITPMIDVLLVLIIIFMMIQPHERGLEAQVPQPSKQVDKSPPPETLVVLEILNGTDGKPVVRINSNAIPAGELEAKLRDIYKSRQEKILFLKGDAKLEFSEVAHVMDITRSADTGIRVGLITRDLQNAD